MASEVDIANLALAHLGDDATVSSLDPPEGSAQAEQCARFYSMARDALLQMHSWGFATKRVNGALLTSETDSWDYAYAVPANCLQMLAVLPPETSDDYVAPYVTATPSGVTAQQTPYGLQVQTQPFEVETLEDGTVVVYTDQEDAVLRFIARVTDASKFPPLFVNALARLLAHYLAGPLLKGDVGRAEADGQYKKFLVEFGKATAQDGNASRRVSRAVPPWMAGR